MRGKNDSVPNEMSSEIMDALAALPGSLESILSEECGPIEF